MTLLTALNRGKHLRTLDDALAQSLRRLDPVTPDSVLAAAALASLAVANGHAGFDPARPQLLIDAAPAASPAPALPWPDAATWSQQLRDSRWIAQPDDPLAASADDAPLVFEQTGPTSALLYLRRYREYEARLARGLRRIAAQSLPAHGIDAVRRVFTGRAGVM